MFSGRSWSTQQGLPDDQVRDILQSHDGYLWLATRFGLARFDGVRFVVFDRHRIRELPSNWCTVLAEDSEHSLWIGTAAGIVRRQWGEFTGPGGQEGWPDQTVITICPSVTTGLWVGLFTGLARFHAGGWKTYTDERWRDGPMVFAVQEDHRGGIWVGTRAGIQRLDPESGRFDEPMGSHGHPRFQPGAIYKARDESLWTAAYLDGHQTGLCHFLNGGWLHDERDPISVDDRILTSSVDQPGRFWQPSSRWLPSLRFDPLTHRIKLGPEGRESVVTSLCEDRQGHLWLGTEDAGLHQWRPTDGGIQILQLGLAKRRVLAVCEDNDGAMWVGNDGGLSCFVGGQPFTSGAIARLAERRVQAVAADADGSLWIGTPDGLEHLHSNVTESVVLPHEDSRTEILSLLRTTDGSVWVGTGRRIHQWSAGAWKTFDFPGAGSGSRPRVMIESREGSLWVGTDHGLFRGGPAGFRQVPCSREAPEPRVFALAEDAHERLWIGTRAGLFRLQGGNCHPFTEGSGVPCLEIHAILDDGDDQLWLRTTQGLFRAGLRDLNDVAEGRCDRVDGILLTQEDGLPAGSMTDRASANACRTQSGELWFPSPNGVVIVRPSLLRQHSSPGVAVVEELLADGQVVFANDPPDQSHPGGVRESSLGTTRSEDSSQRDAAARPAVRIQARQAHVLEFNFTANQFPAPERVRFKCHLDGYDSRWVETGVRRSIAFTGLRPGSYAFQLVASAGEQPSVQASTTFAFIITPEFHQTMAFKSASALSAACVLALMIRQGRRHRDRLERLRRDLAIARDRARIARDLHDGLGANLTHISLLADLLRRAGSAPAPLVVEDRLQQLTQHASLSVEMLRDLLWAVDPVNPTLEGFWAQAISHAHEFLEVAEIACRIAPTPDLPAWNVHSTARHSLLLAFKEAVNNIVRHSRATEARFSIELIGAHLTIVVEDNGAGFASDAPSASPRPAGDQASCRAPCENFGDAVPESSRAYEGRGLANIRSRMETLGGRVLIESLASGGTRVLLEIPLLQLRSDSKEVEVIDEPGNSTHRSA